MIVSRVGDDFLLVRQTDHAALAGELARHWGRDPFRRPEPFAAVALAADRHDNGWQEWEERPRLNPATRVPYQFTELPVEEHLTLYLRGVDRVVAQDRYAGLLVNLHCTGLYNRRYGIDPSIPTRQFTPDEQRIIQDFRTRLEAQQRQLKAALGLTDETTLWTNYKLLQIYDRLSLYLCMPPLRAGSLKPAPTAGGGPDVELTFRPRDEQAVVVTPYPFDSDPLPVRVPTRRIPGRPYDSDEQLREILDRAAFDTRALTLTGA